MATHNVDKKIVGRLAAFFSDERPPLSQALFQLLGLSEMLSRRLIRARRHRKARNEDDDALEVFHHVIWMSREGLAIVEKFFPEVDFENDTQPELRVLFYKLRASFYHIFVLFHNNPRIPLSPPGKQPSSNRGTPLSLGSGNVKGSKLSPPHRKDVSNERSRSRSHTPGGLRDSMISEESAVTNPWATLSPPPGLGGIRRALQPAPDPAAFLLPSADYVASANGCFMTALKLAKATLQGSSPIRLSVALEYCAFLWDCQHDHDGCRRLASETINAVWEAQEGMEDDDFEDAAQLVGTLGRMMRRRSTEDTPRIGSASPTNPAIMGDTRFYTDDNPPPPLPKDSPPPPRPSKSPRRGKVPDATQPSELDKLADAEMLSTEELTATVAQIIPRRPVGSPPSSRKAPSGSPQTARKTVSEPPITRKPVGSASKRTASPSEFGSPSKRSPGTRSVPTQAGSESGLSAGESSIPKPVGGTSRSNKAREE